MQGNPWLANGEARVILLEVNSQNPSQINGFIEIAGQRSEIIVANPAGLNVNGSGFINASRGTLTTGAVNLDNGQISGYTVRGGTVTIGSQGFDASLTDYTGILARAVALNGPLVAQQLNVITGANQISATGQGTTPTASSGAAPSFAIDVSNLGGMYAGKISLLATEAGVGVRNAGGIQAGGGGLILSANGNLFNQGTLASQGSANLSTVGRFDNSGQVQSTANLTIQNGGDLNNSGSLLSTNSLTVNAGNIENTGTIRAGAQANVAAKGRLNNGNEGQISAGSQLSLQGTQLSNTGKLSAGQEVRLTSAGNLNNGGSISSGGTLEITASDIYNSGQIGAATEAQFTASGQLNNSGDISAGTTLGLQGTQVANTGSLNAGQQLSLSSAGRFDNAGQIVIQGGVKLSAPLGIGNSGNIESQKNIDLETAADIANSGRLVADGALAVQAGKAVTNTGSLMGDQGVTIQGAQAINNQGDIFSGAQTTLTATADIDNLGQLVGDGNMQLLAGQHIHNRSGAQVYAAGQLQAQAGQSILNEGLMGAGEDVQLKAKAVDGQIASTASAVLAAGMDASGAVSMGKGRLVLQGGNAGTIDLKSLTLAGQQIQAHAGAIDLRGQDLLTHQLDLHASQGNILAQGASLQTVQQLRLDAAGELRTDHAVLGATQIDITAAQWNLQGGQLQQAGTSAADASIAVRDHINLSGANIASNAESLTLASKALQLDRTTLTHAGRGTLVLQSQGSQAVVANDALLSTGGSLQLEGAALQAQRGIIASQADATLKIQGAITATDSNIVANRALDLQAGSLSADGANLVGVSGSAKLTIGGPASLRNGSVQSEADVAISTGSLDSSDGLISGQDININTHGGALSNADGAVLALNSLTVNSGALDNQRGVLQGSGDVNIAATGAVNNQSGQILSESALNLSSTGAIDSHTTTAIRSAIAAGKGLTITAQGLNNQGSDIKSAAALQINAGSGSINNSLGALIAASGNLNISGGALNNQQTNAAHQGIQAQAVNLTVSSLNNINGALLAQDQLAITASGAMNNAGGLLSSTGTLTINDPLATSNPAGKTLGINNGPGGVIATNGSTSINARSLDNSGVIANAGDGSAGSGNIQVALTGALNNRAGAIIQAVETLNVSAAGSTSNAGTLESGNELHLATSSLHNQATGAIRAGLIDLQANSLHNQGLINGAGFTLIQAGTVNNTHAGRIYGGDIAIAANQLNNTGGGGTDPVIASRNDLDLAVGVVNNTDKALLLSLGVRRT